MLGGLTRMTTMTRNITSQLTNSGHSTAGPSTPARRDPSQGGEMESRGSMDHYPASPDACAVDSESLGRLAQDVSALNAFFFKHVSPQDAGDILFIVNELSTMLALPLQLIMQHAVTRMDQHPIAAQAICDVCVACMKAKGTISKQEIEVRSPYPYPYLALTLTLTLTFTLTLTLTLTLTFTLTHS